MGCFKATQKTWGGCLTMTSASRFGSVLKAPLSLAFLMSLWPTDGHCTFRLNGLRLEVRPAAFGAVSPSPGHLGVVVDGCDSYHLGDLDTGTMGPEKGFRESSPFFFSSSRPLAGTHWGSFDVVGKFWIQPITWDTSFLEALQRSPGLSSWKFLHFCKGRPGPDQWSPPL